MAEMDRFTAYLSEQERDCLNKAEEDFGVSRNYVVRLALRHAFGLPLKPGQLEDLSRLSQVTNTTPTEV